MTHVVILDDGISYFTNPTDIQRVYGRFWDEGLPISLAITPALKGDTRLATDPTRYDSAIPPAHQGDSRPFKVSQNTTLCNYLNVMADQRLVEICMRGYHGTIDEFNTNDDILLQQKIEEGKAELHRAFPDAEIATVVLPDSQHDETARQLLTEYDFHICTHDDSHTPLQGVQSVLTDQRKWFKFGSRLFEPNLPPTPIPSHDLIIVRLACQSLYNQQAPTDHVAQWDQFVTRLLDLDNVTIDTFAYI